MLRFGIKKLLRNDSRSFGPLIRTGGYPADFRFMTTHAHLTHFDTTLILKKLFKSSVLLTSSSGIVAGAEAEEILLSEINLVLSS